jgi:hypothetical protein
VYYFGENVTYMLLNYTSCMVSDVNFLSTKNHREVDLTQCLRMYARRIAKAQQLRRYALNLLDRRTIYHKLITSSALRLVSVGMHITIAVSLSRSSFDCMMKFSRLRSVFLSNK